MMASIYSSMQFATVQRSRFPSLCVLPCRSSTTSAPVRSALFTSKAKHLELTSLPVGLCGKSLKFSGSQLLRLPGSFQFPIAKAAAADADDQEIEVSDGFSRPTKSFGQRFPALVTGFFFFTWYFLNVIFNALNKKVYNYFPYPYCLLCR